MKNIPLFITVLLLPFLSFAQTGNQEIKLDFHQLIVQGLSDESILVPQLYPLRVKKIEIEESKYVEYAEKGSPFGQPVIFLHGLSDSWHSFEKVLPLLPDDYHALALSQRGHGASSKNFQSFEPKDFAKDIAVFMQKLNIPSAIIVGHSMGGVIAQQFAIKYPELVNALVIVDSDASWKDNPGAGEFFEMAMQLKEPISKEFIDAFQKSTIVKPVDAVYYTTLLQESLQVPARVFKGALKGMNTVNFLPLLPQVRVPVLLLWGDKDSVCQLSDQQKMLAAFKDAKLIVYPATGHALHWEEPQRFTSDLVRFFKQINQ
ncbi:MAG TPA: alpha/beta hydrolase [Flavisolibacter sp.]|nr:alpha/beta hydrolase [Flavisolibacter sp.]